jgi:hypothetical protein
MLFAMLAALAAGGAALAQGQGQGQGQGQVQLQQAPTGAAGDNTAPGTGAVDLLQRPIVNGKDLQPRPSMPPTKAETQAIDRLLQETPAGYSGPAVQPRDLFGNPLGGSPGSEPKKP